MGKIVLARIDDRLIHGQVMTAWTQYTNANEIIVVDAKVASDKFLTDIITSAVPDKMKALVLKPEDVVTHISQETNEKNNYLLLAKGPKAFVEVIQHGIQLESIDIGGMGQKGDRKQLYRNIAANQEERTYFKKLLEKGVNVYIQVVPANKKIGLTNEMLG
ncbi:PTS sugar transporter subunit IIB [Liquorilactobacillus satsumensis]|uniref:PTS sugar transporter subunit IIB n=1 Tax=Liquorilactobacillus satsumensis TaxID=259059 RepID=UPI0021C4BEAE|nr:PTS sugar transporter subunit IIB [Liquorilactobacillus satsumensis]MCP9356899.1 PTS sugar transporter subunit IIB [Liquorilactobacillus satsumensis]MCP9370846.1 PTS sugar transporter subunit IIB [Liquorilactobacillus satsumensis]